ncbi:MAG: tRNA (guanosine(37)-N1)-methyltransferase TrmD [Gammaproteobacteria bacterium]|nr:tRNA (guanosine(37)-N1)-methyltransferase TrmD [Gammaproteobacteria bacterium]MCH9716052.1 tRNA (guanosine(37)-N1)-methyltransferase TrmD [Gammaproteobacteria bacterium]MCH9763479.1 tRNA (guanosine(37)-N1)-methyltransferase TrmD [Gammaproteobacteria bacterium]
MQLGVISVMPDMFASLQYGVTGRALVEQRIQMTHWNPRDWAPPPHRSVDDKPYGGGPGMVMRYEPLHATILEGKKTLGKACKTVYLSPQGMQVKQAYLKQLADLKEPILFVAGRYEGIDERVLVEDIDEEWSLGDFVLSGGEFAAMVFIDALARLLPGSLGHPLSAQEDSFMEGLLDHPHYTRPPCVDGSKVPDVLLQGDHGAIERWRRKQALGQTWLKRPDLLSNIALTHADQQLLSAFKHEYGQSCTQDGPLEE